MKSSSNPQCNGKRREKRKYLCPRYFFNPTPNQHKTTHTFPHHVFAHSNASPDVGFHVHTGPSGRHSPTANVHHSTPRSAMERSNHPRSPPRVFQHLQIWQSQRRFTSLEHFFARPGPQFVYAPNLDVHVYRILCRVGKPDHPQ